MKQQISLMPLVVRNYDEAISFYTERVGFKLLEDTKHTANQRWVRVGPQDGSFALLLAKADGEKEEAAIGKQSGRRVFLLLQTDEFWSSSNAMKDKGVRFKDT
ncbi:MAG: VOC family protein, partial [Flavobacteriaceae bacterium]